MVDGPNRVKSLLEQISDTPNVKLIVCMDGNIPKELEHEANKHSISILPFSQVEVGDFFCSFSSGGH